MTDCENCGTPSVEVVRVRRVYLTPESWDAPGSRRVVPEPEVWCLTCISLYPAEPAD